MPRKAPKEVIEHRITLGDYERAQLDKAADAYRTDKYLENVDNVVKGVIYGVGAAGIFYAGYGLYKWFNLPSITDAIKETVQNVDLFLRPYANSELANQKVAGQDGALAGRVDEFMNFIAQMSFSVANTETDYQLNLPTLIDNVNTYFDDKIEVTTALLLKAQKLSESDNYFISSSNKRLTIALEKAIQTYNKRRNYCVWALQNVTFNRWTQPNATGWNLPPSVEYGIPNGVTVG